ncbi:ABC transporter ATP-binding protein [Bacillus benzoevorans]|uniref:ABC-2 type transport system ATP-binding protein n=1 Tax=Bacillus benzoevorans TaxID=1456 RepID=A0A7X0HW36_9BACI|nr:ABC transporter ATP-binding protein [Bacillus benzoevorans]MBB6447002.1 ABC-2 type transport system ATP-binding protein [Bacillus benzoevorans]
MRENILLQVNELTKTYGQHQAVKQLSFQIEKGKCIAIIGPNGAGKTTTLHMLAGLLTPSSGTILFPGSKKKDYRQLIGFLPQHPAFFSWMTAKEFLQFAGRLSHLTKAQLTAKIDETLAFVSLLDVKNKKIGGFSGGMKQRLGLAQALIHDPELLILDEPVSALDPNGRRDVLKMLQALKARMTILFSTHVLHDAEQVCDSVIMLKEGKIKWNGSLTELKYNQSASAIKIRTTEPLEHRFDGMPKLAHIEYQDLHTAVLYFDEPSFDKRLLLTRIIENKLNLLHFEHLQDSLEDAYLKVMNQ